MSIGWSELRVGQNFGIMKWLVGGIVTFGRVFAGAHMLLRQEAATSVDEAGNTVLHFGALPIPVTDDEPLSGRPPIFRGTEVNPAPEFDVQALGDDLTFVMGEPDRSEVEGLGGDQDLFGFFGRAVYVGHDVDATPVYLFQQTGPSLVDAVRSLFTDYEATGIFGSTYDCCRSQSNEGSAPVVNQVTFGTQQVGGVTYGTVEMWAIQDDVSAIAFTDSDGNPLGWQRPVSGFVGARFEADSGATGSGSYRMIAYDAEGIEVDEASWDPPQG